MPVSNIPKRFIPITCTNVPFYNPAQASRTASTAAATSSNAPKLQKQEQVRPKQALPSRQMHSFSMLPLLDPFSTLFRPAFSPVRFPVKDVSLDESDGTTKLSMDVAGFSPEEVKVSVTDYAVKVTAEKERKDDKGNVVGRRFVERTMALPDFADSAAITSRLDQDAGRLIVEVPKKQIKESVKNEQSVNVRVNKEAHIKEDTVNVKVKENHADTVDQAEKLKDHIVSAAEAKMEAKTEAYKTDEKVEVPKQEEPNFEVRTSIAGFSPSDLSVAVDATRAAVVLKARTETDTEAGSEVNEVTRTFKVDPAAFDLDTVKCEIDKDVLVIRAERKVARESNYQVPIVFAS